MISMEDRLSEVVSSPRALDRRISRSATIVLNANIAEVFPLFGPIREKEWAEGWNPEIIYSLDPLVEEGMIFRTPGNEEDYLWVLTKYSPDHHVVVYTVHTSTRVWFIRVECKPAGNKTSATVTYTYTALTKEAIELNRSALRKMFASDLRDWEEAINIYLRRATRQD
jgi:hypothetical protein